MSPPLHQALIFLISTVFELYLIVLILRLILVWIRADYFNPLVQFITRLTDVIVKPLRRVTKNIGRVETASCIWIILIDMLKFILILALTLGYFNLPGVFILTLADILRLFIQVFTYAIILQAIMSWVQPYSPINYILYQVTSPITRPFQRLIPPIGGIDVSPIPAIIVLQVLLILLVNPLNNLGMAMVLG